MNGLALCAGVGGLELGVRIATGGNFRVVCHVEREAYSAATLVARMEDKALDHAPVWDDLASFDGVPWRGLVDCITAGIPCQPYSLAGARAGHTDERALWPELVRIVEECEPTFVFIENVPDFLKHFEPVWSCLSGVGFRFAPPLLQTAAERGAPHIRRRVFILAAHTDRAKLRHQSRRGSGPSRRGSSVAGSANDGIADAAGVRLTRLSGDGKERVDQRGHVASDSSSARLEVRSRTGQRLGAVRDERSTTAAGRGQPADANVGRLQSEWRGWVFDPERQTLWHDAHRCGNGCRICGTHWETESPPVRMDDGFPGRVDELRAIGNAVIPDMAAAAWTYLMPLLIPSATTARF
jgi:DNA (cytosine-5)-methyltransferase 1